MSSLHVRIVGTGLIGTSIALALAERGHCLELDDIDRAALELAQDLVRPQLLEGIPGLVVIATPPAKVLEVLKTEFARNPKATFIDISSVKNKLVQEVESISEIARNFVGTHPMAGREVSGPSSAQADLFNGRAWIITPTAKTETFHLDLVTSFVASLGATPYLMGGQEHDRLLARISHLPQVIATGLGAMVSQMQSGLDLSGQGLRDMTRLANSDGPLWSEILLANNEEILEAIDQFSHHIADLRKAIEKKDSTNIQVIFKDANSGRAKVSGKHGAQPRNYSYVLVVIKDEPGALRNLFDECAKLDANIEDLSIEHSPKQESGLITLAFSPDDANRVEKHLSDQGWKVHIR